MNVLKNIFNNPYNIGKCVGVFAVLAVVSFANNAFAASDYGCSDEDNDRITPELALCSTHVYNIGLDKNPETDNDKQLMRDVVALKTTVMTQQMKSQYDYLDATIRRFKTQLEKAILTTKLQAAGADTGGTSSSASASNDRNVVLIGAENCLLKSNTSDGLSCIQNNIRIVLQAVSAGNIGEAYRQLQKDISFAKAYSIDTDKLDQCNNLSAKRDVVNNCAYQLNVAVMTKIEDSKFRQQNNNQQK